MLRARASIADRLTVNRTPQPASKKMLQNIETDSLSATNVQSLQNVWNGVDEIKLRKFVTVTSKWTNVIEQMDEVDDANIFNVLGTAQIFAPHTKDELMAGLILTTALDHGKFIIRPEFIRKNARICASNGSKEATIRIDRDNWFERPQEIEVDLDKCGRMLNRMKSIPFFASVVKMCSANTLPVCPDKGSIRCSITPESAMHSSSVGVHAYQTVAALIVSPNVVFTERGQQKEFGWLLKQEMIQQTEAAKRKLVSESEEMITDELDEQYDLLSDKSAYDIQQTHIKSRNPWLGISRLLMKDQKILLMTTQEEDTTKDLQEALAGMDLGKEREQFAFKSREFFTIMSAVVLMRKTNSTVRKDGTRHHGNMMRSSLRRYEN